jgi:succinoglycan biosynthesis transport protein ExoP
MELRDYVRLIARRWRTMLAVLLIVMCAGVGYIVISPKEYAARSQIFFSVGSVEDGDQLLDLTSFSQQRVKSYAAAVTSPRALQPVIDELGLDTTTTQLSRSVDATVPLDTVLLEIVVTGESRQEAQEVAQALNDSMLDLITDLEQPLSGQYPLEVSVLQDGVLDRGQQGPSAPIILIISFLVGSVLAFAVGLLRNWLDPRLRDEADVRALLVNFHRTTTFVPDPSSQVDTTHTTEILRPHHLFKIAAESHDKPIMVLGRGRVADAASVGLRVASEVMSEQHSVCVIDLDTEKSGVSQLSKTSSEQGVVNLLGPAPRPSVREVAAQWLPPEAWVIPAGRAEDGAGERPSTRQVAELMGQLQQEYELLVFVGASRRTTDLTAAFIARCEIVIAVAVLGKMRKRDLGRLLEAAYQNSPQAEVAVVIT